MPVYNLATGVGPTTRNISGVVPGDVVTFFIDVTGLSANDTTPQAQFVCMTAGGSEVRIPISTLSSSAGIITRTSDTSVRLFFRLLSAITVDLTEERTCGIRLWVKAPNEQAYVETVQVGLWKPDPRIIMTDSDIIEGVGVPVSINITSINNVTDLFYFNDTLQLSAEALEVAGFVIADTTFTWTVDDEEIGTVNSSGVVTPVTTTGTLTVFATTRGVTGSFIVNITSEAILLWEDGTTAISEDSGFIIISE